MANKIVHTTEVHANASGPTDQPALMEWIRKLDGERDHYKTECQRLRSALGDLVTVAMTRDRGAIEDSLCKARTLLARVEAK